MAHTLICIKTRDTILNYGIFSKEAAPVQFEGTWQCLSVRKDPCTDGMSQYFIIGGYITKPDAPTQISLDEDKCKCEKQYNDGYCKCCDTNNTQPFSFILLNVNERITQTLPSNVAYCCFQEIFHSRTFRKRFISYMNRNCKRHKVKENVCTCEDVFNIISCGLQIPLLIEICVDRKLPVINVCLAWCYRVEGLAKKRLILEETMAWLSTLGGGYSSLGDYFLSFSHQAGKISVTQLKIALEMGDPIMASKCRMFFALSLMQAGKLRSSKKMLRKEYESAIQNNHRDIKLLDMCKGMWSKLQYFYMRRNNLNVKTIRYKQSNTACSYIQNNRHNTPNIELSVAS